MSAESSSARAATAIARSDPSARALVTKQLRAVRLDIRIRRKAGRPPEIADHQCVVGLEEQSFRVERPVGDAGLVHPSDSTPQIVEHRIGGAPRGRQLHPVGLHHEQGVVRDRSRGHDREDGDVGPFGEQRDERLVLDLLEATEGEGRRLIAVPQRGPDRGQELAVPRVSSIDLHQEGPAHARGRAHHGDSSGLQPGRLDIDGVESQVGEGDCDLLCGGPAAW